jgi:hypothetical protein
MEEQTMNLQHQLLLRHIYLKECQHPGRRYRVYRKGCYYAVLFILIVIAAAAILLTEKG